MTVHRIKNNMFPMSISRIKQANVVTRNEESSAIWHMRYGHLSQQGLHILNRESMVIGLPDFLSSNQCEACILGKQKRVTFPSEKAWRANGKLQLVHVDLCGPMQTESMGGSRYFLLFIDDHTRMNWVYFLKCKSDAFKYFKIFQSLVERQAGTKLKTLRTDHDGEFTSNEFMAYYESQGI